MMLRLGFGRDDAAFAVESAVRKTLGEGHRTRDIALSGRPDIGTAEMGDKVVAALM